MLDKLEYITSLLAGLGVAIGGFVLGQELVTVLFNIFIVMIVFYIIGLITRLYLRAKVFPLPTEDDDELPQEDYELLDEELTEGTIEASQEDEEKSDAKGIVFSDED